MDLVNWDRSPSYAGVLKRPWSGDWLTAFSGADAGYDLQLSSRVRSFGVPVIVERPMCCFAP